MKTACMGYGRGTAGGGYKDEAGEVCLTVDMVNGSVHARLSSPIAQDLDH